MQMTQIIYPRDSPHIVYRGSDCEQHGYRCDKEQSLLHYLYAAVLHNNKLSTFKMPKSGSRCDFVFALGCRVCIIRTQCYDKPRGRSRNPACCARKTTVPSLHRSMVNTVKLPTTLLPRRQTLAMHTTFSPSLRETCAWVACFGVYTLFFFFHAHCALTHKQHSNAQIASAGIPCKGDTSNSWKNIKGKRIRSRT